MAERVVRAAHDLPVLIVSDDPDVTRWAESVGAEPFSPAITGLNPSVAAGFTEARRRLTTPDARVIVAHADIPLAVDLRVVDGSGVAIAPDRWRDGSNVLSIPAAIEFEFAYGPGSFERHRREAARRRQPVTVIDDPNLALDVDHPDDLEALEVARTIRQGSG